MALLLARSERKEQECLVCQYDQDLLTAPFEDSYLCIQAHGYQHYPPSNVWLAARNLRGPRLSLHFEIIF